MARIPIPQQTVFADAGRPVARRADAGDFYDSSGDAMLAKGLANAGSTLSQFDTEQRAKKDREAKFNVQVQTAQEAVDWTQKFDQRKQEAPLGAPDFTKSTIAEFDTETQKNVDAWSSTEDAKKDYILKRQGIRQSLASNSVSFEAQSRATKARSDTEGTLKNYSQVAAADPNAYDKTKGEWGQTVDALPVDAITKDALRKEGEKTIRIAAARGIAERDPQGVKTALQTATGVAVGPDDSFQAALKQRESGGRPGIVNEFGYAGLYQFGAPRLADIGVYTPGAGENLGSWSKTGKNADGKWSGTFNIPGFPQVRSFSQFLANPAAQEAAFSAHVVKMDQEIKDLGLAKYEGQTVGGVQISRQGLYGMMHLGGAGGAQAALASGGSSNAADANGSTVLSYAKLASSAPNGSSVNLGQTGNPILDALDAEERSRVLGFATTQLNQQQATARVGLEQKMDDAKSAYLTTGEYTGPGISKAEFYKAYDPQQADDKWKSFEATKQVGEQVAIIKTLPATEIEGLLLASKPQGTGEGFALQQQKFETLAKAADTVRKQREADPASYVMQTFPQTKAAWSAIGQAATPDDRAQATRTAISSMDAAYEKMGVPVAKRDLLPKATVEQTINAYQDETKPLEERVNTLKSLLGSTPDPEQRTRVFNQLVRQDSKLGKLEAAFGAWFRGDVGASNRLFRAGAEGDPEKMAGKLPVKDSEINQAIADTVMSKGKIGDAVYGLTAGVIGNEEKARRDVQLMGDAIRFEVMRNGGNLNKAVEQASKDIYGNVKVVSDWTGLTASIPKEVDDAAFRKGADALRPEFRRALESYMPAEAPGLDAAGKERFRIQQRDAKTYVDQIMAKGAIRNVDGGYGLVNPETGEAVTDRSGRKVVFPIDRVLAAGSGSVAPIESLGMPTP